MAVGRTLLYLILGNFFRAAWVSLWHGFSRPWSERVRRKLQTFFDLDRGFTHDHFLFCLFIRSRALHPVHTPENGIQSHQWKGGAVTDLWIYFKSTTPLYHVQVLVTQTDCRLGELEGEMVEPLSMIFEDLCRAGELGRWEEETSSTRRQQRREGDNLQARCRLMLISALFSDELLNGSFVNVWTRSQGSVTTSRGAHGLVKLSSFLCELCCYIGTWCAVDVVLFSFSKVCDKFHGPCG